MNKEEEDRVVWKDDTKEGFCKSPLLYVGTRVCRPFSFRKLFGILGFLVEFFIYLFILLGKCVRGRC